MIVLESRKNNYEKKHLNYEKTLDIYSYPATMNMKESMREESCDAYR